MARAAFTGVTASLVPVLTSRDGARAARVTLLEWLDAGRIDPVGARVLPLEQAAEAQRHLIEDRPFGRVLLRMGR
ncbi:zinc-binding dehydrogenase [Streptomyces sp. MRC013]|uniref:zinc-binding dehydrogenase n=1 Tax=Streptomyces sp. MRC013 TaxID=2898276 RepID=UPI002025F9C1|nr:zinc-binding dehydrogenase [Streptomyces sp. MRC013]URM92575.1 zinc-binding dehydrogenase [Streptomyces sp. MRC013]